MDRSENNTEVKGDVVDEVEVIGDVGMKNEWISALSGSGREKWGKWGNSSAEDKVGGGEEEEEGFTHSFTLLNVPL